jgi:hypothetical protein
VWKFEAGEYIRLKAGYVYSYLLANNEFLIDESENELKRSLYGLNVNFQDYNQQMCISTSKVMAF